MNSIYKIALLVGAVAFAAPTIASPAMARHHTGSYKHHQKLRHYKNKKSRYYNGQNGVSDSGSRETADLNARSLQDIQSTKNNTVAIVPTTPAPQTTAPIAVVPQQVVPGTGNTMAPPTAPVAVPANTVPPVQY